MLCMFALPSCTFNLGNPAVDDEEQVDQRINIVINAELLEKVKGYMTIYDGVNPPNVEGTFRLDPYVYIYSSDGVFEAGHKILPYVIKFSNQDMTNNTLDYNGKHIGNDTYQNGEGVFISGSGNNFTVFFNTVGESNGIATKHAVIMSGTITAEGIKNLRRAFVMLEKGPDPDEMLMDVGTFRIFRDEDELCEPMEWPATARSLRAAESSILVESAK